MSKPNDPDIDWLADAPLTPDQRRMWNHMRADMASSRARIGELEKRIKALETTPPEEGHAILTRPEFNREVARMLAVDERYGGISSVLYFDFDNLEANGERFGKAVANAAVRMIGDTLMKHVRNSDVVGRLANDEFGVLLLRCDNTAAWKKGEQLAGLLYEALAEIHGNKLNVNISFGAYTFHDDQNVAAGIQAAADSMTKGSGKI